MRGRRPPTRRNSHLTPARRSPQWGGEAEAGSERHESLDEDIRAAGCEQPLGRAVAALRAAAAGYRPGDVLFDAPLASRPRAQRSAHATTGGAKAMSVQLIAALCPKSASALTSAVLESTWTRGWAQNVEHATGALTAAVRSLAAQLDVDDPADVLKAPGLMLPIVMPRSAERTPDGNDDADGLGLPHPAFGGGDVWLARYKGMILAGTYRSQARDMFTFDDRIGWWECSAISVLLREHL